jgi:hypothetical protein
MVYYFLRPFGPKLKMCCSEGNSYVEEVSFIGGGNWSIWRKPSHGKED